MLDVNQELTPKLIRPNLTFFNDDTEVMHGKRKARVDKKFGRLLSSHETAPIIDSRFSRFYEGTG